MRGLWIDECGLICRLFIAYVLIILYYLYAPQIFSDPILDSLGRMHCEDLVCEHL